MPDSTSRAGITFSGVQPGEGSLARPYNIALEPSRRMPRATLSRGSALDVRRASPVAHAYDSLFEMRGHP